MWADVLFLNIWLPRPERERGWPPPAPPQRPRTNRPPEGRGSTARPLPAARNPPPLPRSFSRPFACFSAGPRRRAALRRVPACRSYVSPFCPPPRPPAGGTALQVALRGRPHVISPPRRRPAARAASRQGQGGHQPPRGGPRPAEGPSASPPLPAGRACLGLAAAEASPSPAFTTGARRLSGEPRRAGRASRLPEGRQCGERSGGAEGPRGPLHPPPPSPAGDAGFVRYRPIAVGVYAKARL